MQQNTQALFEVDTLNILDTEKIEFITEKSGFLTLVYDGQRYEKVQLTRLVPFVSETRYISVSYYIDEAQWKEIGVITDMTLLPEKQRETAQSFLATKYYIPQITKIKKITDNQMGYLFLDAETTAGEKKIAVNDWWHNFRLIGKKMLSVTDADGNRYRIPDVAKMDKASIKRLQLFI